MRGGVNDYTSMDTITAAATAIVTAEARVQQSTSVQVINCCFYPFLLS